MPGNLIYSVSASRKKTSIGRRACYSFHDGRVLLYRHGKHLEGHARQITEEMKLAAAKAIAGLVSDEELNEDFIMPEPFDPRVADVVSQAVKSHIEA